MREWMGRRKKNDGLSIQYIYTSKLMRQRIQNMGQAHSSGNGRPAGITPSKLLDSPKEFNSCNRKSLQLSRVTHCQ